MQPNGIITLTTDFGITDSYVGIMKGVILGIAPQARLVDITHAISPQNIHHAAYTLQTFAPYFPAGTVHVVVVDPSVGSRRRAIVLSTPDATFIGPDNGTFTLVWRGAIERWGRPACTVFELAEPRFWLPRVSNTFHGRDIFAPVAGHLVAGTPPGALGPQRDALAEADIEQPTPGRSGGLDGRIIHTDHFGNCITNITLRDLERAGLGEQVSVQIIDQRVVGLSRTFADVHSGALVALIDCDDRLQLALRNGNAAQMLGVSVGDAVRVRLEGR